MSRYYYLEVVANANCEAVNCPLAGQIQRVTHDGHVTHIAVYIHVAPRVAYPYLAPIDVQRHCRFNMEETAYSAIVLLIFLWRLDISTRLVWNSNIAYFAIRWERQRNAGIYFERKL